MQVQEQVGQPLLKTIQEADTCWNSILHLFKYLFELAAQVNASTLQQSPWHQCKLTAEEYANTGECLHTLPTFNDATAVERRCQAPK